MVKMISKMSLLGFVSAFLCLALSAYNQVEAEELLPIKRATAADSWVAAELLVRKTVVYPALEVSRENSGVVEVVFVVDKDGNTKHPMVLRSTGPLFEIATLNAIQKYRYKPATLGGEEVQNTKFLRMIFAADGTTRSNRRWFKREYSKVRKMLEQDNADAEKIQKRLNSLEYGQNVNLETLAYTNALEYDYATRFGSVSEQIDALHNVLFFETFAPKGRENDESIWVVSVEGARKQNAASQVFGNDYTGLDIKSGKNLARTLPLELMTGSRRSLIKLYLKRQNFGEALHAYNELTRYDSDAQSAFGGVMTKVRAIQNGQQAFATDLSISERGYASTYLLKSTISFQNITGELSKLKLRCEKKYHEQNFQADKSVQIPKSWGACHLQVLGTQGTTAQLVQS